MLALINISSNEYPEIIKGEVLFKDDMPGRGLHNYIILTENNNKLISVHRNKILNYDELVKFYEDRKRNTK